ncbi:MAG: YabP/YqfC family sporulation protein [Clostridia bacterium]|nr:YabP/YqfC family sporulation protein [Clostridia bacterium]
MPEMELEKLLLEGRRRLQMTAVEAVEGFSEQSLRLLVKGNKVLITGRGIKITAFNKQSGNLAAEGEFNEIKFGGEKQPIFKRIFK